MVPLCFSRLSFKATYFLECFFTDTGIHITISLVVAVGVVVAVVVAAVVVAVVVVRPIPLLRVSVSKGLTQADS